MSFEDDVQFGDKGEEYVKYILAVRGIETTRTEGYFPDYDLIAKDGTTYEVKTDRKSQRTGNVFLETEYNGKPSGIHKTKADYYVFLEYATRKMWMMKTQELIEFMKVHYVYFDRIHAGDGATGYLIPKKFLSRNYITTLDES